MIEVGDLVKVIDTSGYPHDHYLGALGRVVYVDETTMYPYEVRLIMYDEVELFKPSELELIVYGVN